MRFRRIAASSEKAKQEVPYHEAARLSLLEGLRILEIPPMSAKLLEYILIGC